MLIRRSEVPMECYTVCAPISCKLVSILLLLSHMRYPVIRLSHPIHLAFFSLELFGASSAKTGSRLRLACLPSGSSPSRGAPAERSRRILGTTLGLQG